MRVLDTSGIEFIFDEIPVKCVTEQVVVFTHLCKLGTSLHFPTSINRIHTSHHLAERFIRQSVAQDSTTKLQWDHFNILPVYEPHQISLATNTSCTVLACEEEAVHGQNVGQRLMLIVKTCKKQAFFYAGICTRFRRAFMNDTFAAWLNEEVNVKSLYLNLQWAHIEQTNQERTALAMDHIAAYLRYDISKDHMPARFQAIPPFPKHICVDEVEHIIACDYGPNFFVTKMHLT